MTGRRWNQLIQMVNLRIPKEDAGELTKEEAKTYDSMWKDAVAHEEKYGSWPVYDNVEIEWGDPCLDIYKDPV